jgi:DNA polymerase elongation subunit (family B)/DNA-directed RNA polymerase subunit RPC12/RpoP
MKPKILFLDIETAPNTAYVWGLWDQNISHEHLETSSYILCWSAKWPGHSRMHFASAQHNDTKVMLKEIHTLLSMADVVVHYNGCKFDIPTLNKSFIKRGMTPPSPYKQVDLLKVCRQAFRFESNKLDAVLKSLDLGAKVKHRGFQLWIGCMKGDKQCWREMERYNKGDVIRLEKLYNKLLPWIERHPNLGVYSNKPACTNCGSNNVQRRGKQVAITQWYARLHCQECGRWFRGEKESRT